MDRKSALIFILIIVSIIFSIFNMSKKAFSGNLKPYYVTDFTGQNIRFNETPFRIISTAPNITEILFSLGAGNRVVGVTRSCNYPREAQSIPKISNNQMDIEKVIQLKPDLIIEESTLRIESLSRIKNIGLRVLTVKCDNIRNFKKSLMIISSAIKKDDTAKSLISEFDRRLNHIEESINKYASDKNVKVFLEIWNKPIITVGGGLFIDDLIRLSGGENIFKDTKNAYPKVNIESIIKKNPEVIILTTSEKKEIIQSQAWKSISAVKSGKVYKINPDILARPTLRMIEALETITLWLHPEIKEKNSLALRKLQIKQKAQTNR